MDAVDGARTEVAQDEVIVLHNAVRAYAWGSRTHIPRFLGESPDDAPAAELWLGAHPAAPSRSDDGDSLLARIEADPVAMLGEDAHDRFGVRLPFLMKVLAAAEPLSIQVHPDGERARVGFAAEERAGIPRDAPHRTFRDDSHKPELVYALTRFEGMAGFRDVERTAPLLRLLDHPWADRTAARLLDGPAFQALRGVVSSLLTDTGGTAALLDELAACAKAATQRLHEQEAYAQPRNHEPDPAVREAIRVFSQFTALAEHYPGDPGVLVTLLLNHVVLAPGESMFVAPGVIHAYTSGLGVEIMASSDNVLRAGLTHKHVDAAEVLRITDFTPMPPPYWNRVDLDRPDYTRIEPPVDEFALLVAEAPVADLPEAGPRILLVLDGDVVVVTARGRHPLSRGQSAFVAHHAGPIAVEGEGRVAIGSVPTS